MAVVAGAHASPAATTGTQEGFLPTLALRTVRVEAPSALGFLSGELLGVPPGTKVSVRCIRRCAFSEVVGIARRTTVTLDSFRNRTLPIGAAVQITVERQIDPQDDSEFSSYFVASGPQIERRRLTHVVRRSGGRLVFARRSTECMQSPRRPIRFRPVPCPEGREFPVVHGGYAIEVGAGAVWIASTDENRVVQYDVRTGRATRELSIAAPRLLGVARRELVVESNDSFDLFGINSAGRLRTIASTLFAPNAGAVDASGIYLVDDDRLVRVDQSTGRMSSVSLGRSCSFFYLPQVAVTRTPTGAYVAIGCGEELVLAGPLADDGSDVLQARITVVPIGREIVAMTGSSHGSLGQVAVSTVGEAEIFDAQTAQRVEVLLVPIGWRRIVVGDLTRDTVTFAAWNGVRVNVQRVRRSTARSPARGFVFPVGPAALTGDRSWVIRFGRLWFLRVGSSVATRSG